MGKRAPPVYRTTLNGSGTLCIRNQIAEGVLVQAESSKDTGQAKSLQSGFDSHNAIVKGINRE